MVDPGSVLDPYGCQTTSIDGVVVIHVDDNGRAQVLLYENLLEPDGSFAPRLTARLGMSRDTMRQVADAMQNASLVSSYRSEQDSAEMRRKLT